MKTKLLVFFTWISLYANAQLVLLDEPSGTGNANIISVAVYDNDLLYSMIRDNTSNLPVNYVSNGIPEEKIELLAGSNSRAVFHNKIPQDHRRIYGNGNFKVGNNIYAAIQKSGSSDVRIYKFNSSRTFLTPENIFKKTTDASFNINLVGDKELVTIDTIKVNDKNRLRIHHFTEKNGQQNYVLPEGFYGQLRPSSFFKWNGALYFIAKISGESDIYKVDALSTTRVTQNKVSKPTAFKGVSPSNLLLDDYIYFKGRDGFYTNVVPGPLKRNYPTGICYSNGDIDFGSAETAIYSGDDGSLGYKTFSDTSFTENILGKIGDNIIYYALDTKNFFSIPNKVNLDLPIPQEFQFLQSNNKIYVAPRSRYIAEKLYIIDSNLNTQTVDIPVFPNTNNYAQKVGEIIENNDKIYFIAAYFFNGKSRHVLFSYKEGNTALTEELEFPEDILPNAYQIYPFNKGFVFITKTSTFSKESLYTWNVESRAKILNNGSAKGTKLNNNANFKYDGVSYSITLKSATFNENDQLKVQILDTLSTQFKQTVKKFPTNTDAKRMSNLFYSVNTLKAGNTHQSNFTLLFNDAMFSNTTTTSENLSVMAFYNDTWTEITPTSFNNATKEITISGNFPEEVFLFLKINGTLSLNSVVLENNIKLYPNPASTNFTIASENSTILKIEIYNLLGDKVIAQSGLNTTKTKINLVNFAKGIYFVKVKTDNKTISKKLIIK